MDIFKTVNLNENKWFYFHAEYREVLLSIY